MSDSSPESEDASEPKDEVWPRADSSPSGSLEPSNNEIGDRPLRTARGALWAMLAADASETDSEDEHGR